MTQVPQEIVTERPRELNVLHVITRLIVGGAQENTLLTAIGQHGSPGLRVTLLSGIDDGPEGDLHDQARGAGVDLHLMPELVRPIDPMRDVVAAAKLERVLEPCSVLAYSALHAVLATLRDVDHPIGLFGRHATADSELALVNSLVGGKFQAELAAGSSEPGSCGTRCRPEPARTTAAWTPPRPPTSPRPSSPSWSSIAAAGTDRARRRCHTRCG